MTKYFTRDTSLYGLERMMMSVPRFTPRHSGVVVLCHFHYRPQDVECGLCTQFQRKRCAVSACPWLRERLEAGAAAYGELVAGCFHGLEHRPLKRRIAAVTAGKARVSDAGWEHRQRFEQWQGANGSLRRGRVQDQWLAALFLLTSSGKLWAQAWSAISWNGVDFSKITLRDIDPQDYAVYQAAKSLYTGQMKITAAELADEELVSDATLRLIVDGVLIARYGGAVLANVWEGAPC